MKLNIIIGALCFIIAQTMTWFQLNGQFIWIWFKYHPFLIALFGIPISYFYILATKYVVEGFGGMMWPTRFIGFGIGILIYSIFISMFFNEGFSIKTIVSVLLAILILIVQMYWK